MCDYLLIYINDLFFSVVSFLSAHFVATAFYTALDRFLRFKLMCNTGDYFEILIKNLCPRPMEENRREKKIVT